MVVDVGLVTKEMASSASVSHVLFSLNRLISIFNKLTSVFRASVLLLIINFVITLSK